VVSGSVVVVEQCIGKCGGFFVEYEVDLVGEVEDSFVLSGPFLVLGVRVL